MSGLPYIHERLQPFKLDDTDKSCVCPDYCGVSPDVVEDAGLTESELKKLPREVYLGSDDTMTPDCKIKEVYHIFSKSALGAMIGGGK
jgi:hypothetical protein